MFPAAALAAALLAPGGPADPAADLFRHAGPVPVVKVSVDAANLKLLRQNDRRPVRAAVTVGDDALTDVGLHLKGAVGSKRGWDDKPGLTLNSDKFVRGQTFRGLDKFHLNNAVQDGSALHEILANELARAAGLPACRCTHALVELNGRKAGLYVLKEGFDRVWLGRTFPDPSGNLYDGGFLRDVDQDLRLSCGTDVGRRDLKALVKACRIRDRDERYEAVAELVDVDRFAAAAALAAVTGDWDGYVRHHNNYRVYFDPAVSGKAVFVPHGMDQLWQNPEEPAWPAPGGMVAKAVLEHPEGKKKVTAKLKELVRDHFTADKMLRRVDELAPRAKEAVAAVDKGRVPGYEGEVKALKDRLKRRAEFLAREVPKMK